MEDVIDAGHRRVCDRQVRQVSFDQFHLRQVRQIVPVAGDEIGRHQKRLTTDN